MGYRWIVLCYCYNLTKCSRDDASGFFCLVAPHHSMRFAAASLSISEDGAIVAFKDVIDEREGALFVDVALGGIWGEDSIKGKALRLFFSILFD